MSTENYLTLMRAARVLATMAQNADADALDRERWTDLARRLVVELEMTTPS